MTIAIIGVGLIGGSIGLAVKNSKLKIENIIGIGRNIDRLKLAKKLGAVDEVTTDIKNGVKNADIIFICLPVRLIADTVIKIIPFCKKGAIITDVGSVKAPIVEEVEKFLSQSRYPAIPLSHNSAPVFIGGHPIAGSEKTSVKYASNKLFKNAVVVLTSTKKSNKKALNIIKGIWKAMKAKVEIISAERHDEISSLTSHLPHVLAFSLINIIDDFRFTGGGLKDTTRIASSDPGIWADIIFNNRSNVIKAVKKYVNELSKIENAKSKKELYDIFKKAKVKRDKVW
ncbi:MAG: prephenate dehydrogenase [Elusimicrobia bacterium]|nr:prephenate dehydrogenase [Elusimicrobiota bacterium]